MDITIECPRLFYPVSDKYAYNYKRKHTKELRECICYRNKVVYQALPEYYEYMNRKNNVLEHCFKTLNKEDYICTKCGSSDRDILIIMLMVKTKG